MKTPSIKWKLTFSRSALKSLKTLDEQTNLLIISSLRQKLETEESPRRYGEALSGNLKGFWRYKVHHYRIVCDIRDHELRVEAIYVGHRRDIYKKIHLVKS